MMSTGPTTVLVVGGIAYAAYAIPAMLQFFSYCELVASATGRVEENACIKNDGDGLNAFQLEQYRMLRSGEFMKCGDASVVARGMVVARKLRILVWAAAGLVVSVAAADVWGR